MLWLLLILALIGWAVHVSAVRRSDNKQIEHFRHEWVRLCDMNHAANVQLTEANNRVFDYKRIVAIQRKGLEAADALMNESRGVEGLHLNGDIATWDELRTGGKYESWLVDFDTAVQTKFL